MKVFLSSTIYDLKDLRHHIVTEIAREGYEVIASDQGTIPIVAGMHSYDLCLAAAAECDVLIAVIDSRFGGMMPDGSRSITEAEIDTAINHSKPVLVFVRGAVWNAREHYRRTGESFAPTKLVDDERVLTTLERIIRRKTDNWVFEFDFATELLRIARVQLQRMDAAHRSKMSEHQKAVAAISPILDPEHTGLVDYYRFHEAAATWQYGGGIVRVSSHKELLRLWSQFDAISSYEAFLAQFVEQDGVVQRRFVLTPDMLRQPNCEMLTEVLMRQHALKFDVSLVHAKDHFQAGFLIPVDCEMFATVNDRTAYLLKFPRDGTPVMIRTDQDEIVKSVGKALKHVFEHTITYQTWMEKFGTLVTEEMQERVEQQVAAIRLLSSIKN